MHTWTVTACYATLFLRQFEELKAFIPPDKNNLTEAASLSQLSTTRG